MSLMCCVLLCSSPFPLVSNHPSLSLSGVGISTCLFVCKMTSCVAWMHPFQVCLQVPPIAFFLSFIAELVTLLFSSRN